MPSIYPNLKFSDRKFIRTEKARIRRQFLDMAKQREMISELYKKLVPSENAAPQKSAEVHAEKRGNDEGVNKSKVEKPKKVAPKKVAVKK
ncbi:MAG: hypothetical protein A3C50_04060 [Candidatus Staskawiczbacteria bacterium RIFCSPHIGHO2_02_FULL_43_16]|uniref:Uncharacterized protein n=1 Tax=Candidatus Staskawiczbacteria bacterium RIFCSPHIGHO2_01_FULL_41_41 TaxID=1802203 RepID=A0A1G2HRF6_9BACT|nr:MAG: hypothetical protein A2822_00350 [Candidatus Staskawiczbacteria bacterium RIFCSPHIGHO2_01_FULL_41_41]OGZ68104.1 MAG: hypothetical protein A3C50_04060 [Candidatus Staskawiczbacteria bacterium RIFCSPHIGHO2_02_FULL_43_16]